MDIILASHSPIRQVLMNRLCLPYTICSPTCHEDTADGMTPEEIVTELAQRKACSIEDQYPQHIIIGSDSIAHCSDQILYKPHDHPTAKKQLCYQSGRCTTFYTGLCVKNTQTGKTHVGYASAKVQFRTLSEAEIESYLLQDQPYQSSGSIKSESLGITLFEYMESRDPTAIMGLPLIMLSQFLRAEHIHMLPLQH